MGSRAASIWCRACGRGQGWTAVTNDTERVHNRHADQRANTAFIDPDVGSFGRGQSRPLHLRGRYLCVVFIGGLGTLARWSLARWRPQPHGWSRATRLAKLAGAFLLGLILEGSMRRKDRGWPGCTSAPASWEHSRPWSSLATQTVLLAESRMEEAALYLVVTGRSIFPFSRSNDRSRGFGGCV